MGNIAVVLFEPMSMRGWAGKGLAVTDIVKGKKTPFCRYMASEKIP